MVMSSIQFFFFLKVHQTDAFNLKMRDIFFRGSMTLQHPGGTVVHPP